MRLPGLEISALAALAAVVLSADQQTPLSGPAFASEVASLVSTYIPSPVYSQLTASIAVAASTASVDGDPASLFLSAVLATAPPAWFSSAVPTYFRSNVAALEAAISSLRLGGPSPTTSAAPGPPAMTPTTSSSSGSAATATSGAWELAAVGVAALAGLVAVI